MRFSVVVPAFARPDEVTELLKSLTEQHYKNFEVIIADGSLDESLKQVLAKFRHKLKLTHLWKKGLGISESRNWGVENAEGDYVVFFDSDCIIPPAYFTLVTAHLKDHPLDAFGGPDMAAEHFNITQKAISYAMTSLFTTGGIRGSKKSVGPYQPRGFNMGIRRSVFNAVNGFSNLKVSEDIDLSIRLYEAGYKVGFIKEAAVYHKRRSTFYKFFRQVFSFGGGRIDLQFRHGNALKVVHTLPALFVFYIVAGLATLFISRALFSIWLASVLIYSIAILMDASCKNKSLRVGLLSIFASWLMLTGYGSGMIKTAWMRYVMKSTKESEKPEITRH